MTFSVGSYANIPYVYGNLLPGGWANLSGQTHVFTLDPDDYCFNPGIGLNLNALGLLSQVGMGNYGFGGASLNLPDVQTVAESICNPITNNITDGLIKQSKTAVESAKPKLEAMLNDEKFKDKKAEIEALKKRLEEQEQKLKELEADTSMKPNDKQKKAQEIHDEIVKITNDCIALSASVTSTAAAAADNTAADNTATDNTATDNTATDNTATETQGYAAASAAPTTGTSGTTSQPATNTDAKQAQQLADRFHDAITKTSLGIACTDDEEFEAVCSTIDENNVSGILSKYQDSYGNSFMEDFMWDADHEQKQKYGRQIARALREKAASLGISDKCKDSIEKILKELDDVNIDNDIYIEFDNVLTEIESAEKAKKSQA